MADTNSSSAGKARSRGFGSKLFVSICVALLTILVLAFFVLSSGEVTGHEFCPESFSLRQVSYFQLPVLQVQVTPVIRTDQSTNPLLAHIRGQQSWQQTDQPPRWDLAYATAPGLDYQGDAKVLYEYLVAESPDGKNPWVQWSRAHPDLAGVLWPAVVEAARNRHYLLIPHLLRTARSANSVDQLRTALAELKRDSAAWLAELDSDHVTCSATTTTEP